MARGLVGDARAAEEVSHAFEPLQSRLKSCLPKTALAEVFAPDNPCGFTPTSPAGHVQVQRRLNVPRKSLQGLSYGGVQTNVLMNVSSPRASLHSLRHSRNAVR